MMLVLAPKADIVHVSALAIGFDSKAGAEPFQIGNPVNLDHDSAINRRGYNSDVVLRRA